MNLPEKTKQVGGQLVKFFCVFCGLFWFCFGFAFFSFCYGLPYFKLSVCQKLIISAFLQSSTKKTYNHIHFILSANSGPW